MMKTFYRLIKNRRLIADTDNLDRIKEIAVQDAGTVLDWRDFSDDRLFYQCAFGRGDTMNRDEYEIEAYRKRVT